MDNDVLPLRISVPQQNIEKFREIFLYILNEVGAKPNVGKTVLYKLLYFTDFDYYELYEEQIMGLIYIKNTYGPTPKKKFINDLIEKKEVEHIETTHYKKFQAKYLPTRVADLSCISGRELNHINQTLAKYSDKSATELSDLSHKDIPWIVTKDKDIISYESVFYRTPETSVRKY